MTSDVLGRVLPMWLFDVFLFVLSPVEQTSPKSFFIGVRKRYFEVIYLLIDV